jgi:DNA-directed RNA polymerase I, II, and III subunit RPABC2
MSDKEDYNSIGGDDDDNSDFDDEMKEMKNQLKMGIKKAGYGNQEGGEDDDDENSDSDSDETNDDFAGGDVDDDDADDDEDGDDSDDDEDDDGILGGGDGDDADEPGKKKKPKKKTKKNDAEVHEEMYLEDLDRQIKDGEFDDDYDEDEDYLKKLDENIKKNIVQQYHPEINQHNYDEIEALCVIVRNENNEIIDPFHTTPPFLTKYEKARILGERAMQINAGAKPFVQVDDNIINGYLIAVKELAEKKIPFIIKRPMPNGGCEYWKLKDLEILC